MHADSDTGYLLAGVSFVHSVLYYIIVIKCQMASSGTTKVSLLVIVTFI